MAVRIQPKSGRRRKLGRLAVMNPARGLNNLVSDTMIDDKEASALNNVAFTESGCPTKAFGFEDTGSGLTNRPKGLGSLRTATYNELLTIDGTSLMKWTGTTWSAVAGKTFTADKEVVFVQARDEVFIHNGTDAFGKYTGAALTTPTTAITTGFGIFWEGYHWASGVASHRNRVYRSESTDASDFTNANPTGTGEYSVYDGTTHPGSSTYAGTGAAYFDIDKGDGDRITGFASYQDKLIVFKERSVYQITLDSTGQPLVDRVSRSVGAVSHRAITTVENDIFFMTRRGIYVLGNEPNYFNVIRSNELSARMRGTIDSIVDANADKACVGYYDNMFYCGIRSGGSTSINQTMTYDRRYLGWSLVNHIKPNAMHVFVNADNEMDLYFASDDEAKVYKINQGYSAAGTAYTSYWQSKAFDANSPEVSKRWIDLSLAFRAVNGSITIDIYGDNNRLVKSVTVQNNSATGSVSGIGADGFGSFMFGESSGATDTTGVATSNVVYRIKLNTTSRTIKFRITNENENESFTLQGFMFAYREYGHYKFDAQYKLY